MTERSLRPSCFAQWNLVLYLMVPLHKTLTKLLHFGVSTRSVKLLRPCPPLELTMSFGLWIIQYDVVQGIPEALMMSGALYKYDLSIPLEKMYGFVEEMRARLGKKNYFLCRLSRQSCGKWPPRRWQSPQYEDAILAQIKPLVYGWTSKYRESIRLSVLRMVLD